MFSNTKQLSFWLQGEEILLFLLKSSIGEPTLVTLSVSVIIETFCILLISIFNSIL